MMAWRYFHSLYGGGPAIVWDWNLRVFLIDPPNLDAIITYEEQTHDAFEEAMRNTPKSKKVSFHSNEADEEEDDPMDDG